ncbi:MAG: protein translocase subunit SecD, partial [Pseudomonadota bacterium]
MLNRFPLWKTLLVIITLAVSTLYALPNLYPDDFAVQISGTRQEVKVDDRTIDRITRALDENKIAYKTAEASDGAGLIRFVDGEAQLVGREVIGRTLGETYTVALNLAPTTPDWLTSIGAGPMKLGLDLRGGVHFLLEVDMVTAVSQRLEVYVSDIKGNLRSERMRYRQVETMGDGALAVRFADVETRDSAATMLKGKFPEFMITNLDEANYSSLKINLSEQT